MVIQYIINAFAVIGLFITILIIKNLIQENCYKLKDFIDKLGSKFKVGELVLFDGHICKVIKYVKEDKEYYYKLKIIKYKLSDSDFLYYQEKFEDDYFEEKVIKKFNFI